MFINKSNLLRELINLANNDERDEVLTPEEGFIIGNLFYNLYEPYKHYKPMKVVPKNEEETLMLKIQELDLAVNDLNLYLDLYPTDQKCLKLYKEYVKELNKYCMMYAEKYSPLSIKEDLKEGYNWLSPWPWEGKNV